MPSSIYLGERSINTGKRKEGQQNDSIDSKPFKIIYHLENLKDLWFIQQVKTVIMKSWKVSEQTKR